MDTQQQVIVGRDGAATRKDVKRQRREAQLEARRRVEDAARRRRQLVWGAGIALAVAALAALVYWLARPQAGPAVQSLPIQGQQHIQLGEAHPPYNSKPPTSGWHYVQPAPWGISSTPIPDEVQIHNLEHGGIMVQYECPSECPDVVSKLETIVRAYRAKVILAPYSGIGHKLALTAWGRLAYLDEVDESFIRRFIDRYKDKGPELVPDM